MALLSQAAALEPNNADIQLELGLALLAVPRLDAAEQALTRALNLAPGYVDAEIGLGYVELFRGRRLEADGRAQRLLRLYPQRPDVVALAQRTGQPAAAEKASVPTAQKPALGPTRIDSTVSYSHLSGGRAPWREAELAATFAAADAGFLSVSFNHASRFDNEDTTAALRYEAPLAADVRGFISLSGTPDASFKPDAAFAAGGWWTVVDDLGALDALRLTASARFATYTAGDVTSVSGGAEIDVWDGVLFVSAQLIGVWDETGSYNSGQAVQLRLQPNDAFAVRCGWANAPDSSEGRTFLTRTLFAGLEVTLSPQLSASAVYARDELEGLYSRDTGSLGLAYRFQPS